MVGLMAFLGLLGFVLGIIANVRLDSLEQQK